jgi:hypothetical protein
MTEPHRVVAPPRGDLAAVGDARRDSPIHHRASPRRDDARGVASARIVDRARGGATTRPTRATRRDATARDARSTSGRESTGGASDARKRRRNARWRRTTANERRSR